MDGFASAASSGLYQVTADVVVGSSKNAGGQAGSPPEIALAQAGSNTGDNFASNASSPASTSSFQPLAPAGSDVEVGLPYEVPSLLFPSLTREEHLMRGPWLMGCLDCGLG